jgi:hexosaminidase
MPRLVNRVVLPLAFAAASACARQTPTPVTAPVPVPVAQPRLVHTLIPLPALVELDTARSFLVDSMTSVVIADGAESATRRVAEYLAGMLGPVVKPEIRSPAQVTGPGSKPILLRLNPAAGSGPEGYELEISPQGANITARSAAGLFYGVQTLRQLLPVSIEHRAALGRRLVVPAGRIVDAPRYGWRGMMLDVSRHFLPAADVKRFVDLMALYKLNRLHLHLSDDQGWRIEIKSRPSLTAIGGSTQVGGGPGGFYTQDEYRDIVAYAASRFITVVPEIDMPGHTNAALASIPELNCDGKATQLYTGIRVGFSTVCADSARIYPILTDIVREISALTPGPWFHIGGDEVEKLTHDQYLRFIERMQEIVTAQGKQMIGWGEIAPARLSPTTVVQNWKRDSSFVHAARGGKVIMSPAARVYLDMKYDSTTVLGLAWAGLNGLRTSYDWDPGTYITGVPDSAVLGVEAPLWSETVIRAEDYESMAFPRALAVAEVGWTSAPQKRWADFRSRIAAHERRLNALGVNADIAYTLTQSPAQKEFWNRLQSLCGKAFAGRLTDSNASDSMFARSRVVMHVRSCTSDEIRIPLHVGDDRSRTWVITPADGGLRLKHDHRHRDGSADSVTQYGGDTFRPGGLGRQEFAADSLTAALIPAARTNVWTIEIIPGKTFAYGLRRDGTDRKFRVEFDLTQPVAAPPPPWGSR